MDKALAQLISPLEAGPPAPAAALDAVRRTLGPLPDDYDAFLRTANGATGLIGRSRWISLWPADDVVSLNVGYSEGAPGLVVIGSTHNLWEYGIDTRSGDPGSMQYVAIDPVLKWWGNEEARFSSLAGLLAYLSNA